MFVQFLFLTAPHLPALLDFRKIWSDRTFSICLSVAHYQNNKEYQLGFA